jgi:hypothetical protein
MSKIWTVLIYAAKNELLDSFCFKYQSDAYRCAEDYHAKGYKTKVIDSYILNGWE